MRGPTPAGPHGPYRQSERMDLYHDCGAGVVRPGSGLLLLLHARRAGGGAPAAQAAGRAYQYGGQCGRLSPAQAKSAPGRRGARRGAPAHRAWADDLRRPGTGRLWSRMPRSSATRSSCAPTGCPRITWPRWPTSTICASRTCCAAASISTIRSCSSSSMAALGWEPPAFAHFGLLLNPDRSKISKRTGAVYIGEFRDMGYTREAHYQPPGPQWVEPRDGAGVLHVGRPARRLEPGAMQQGQRHLRPGQAAVAQWAAHPPPDIEELTRRVVPFLSRAGSDLGLAGCEYVRVRGARRGPGAGALADAGRGARTRWRSSSAIPIRPRAWSLMETNRFARRHELAALRAGLACGAGRAGPSGRRAMVRRRNRGGAERGSRRAWAGSAPIC